MQEFYIKIGLRVGTNTLEKISENDVFEHIERLLNNQETLAKIWDSGPVAVEPNLIEVAEIYE